MKITQKIKLVLLLLLANAVLPLQAQRLVEIPGFNSGIYSIITQRDGKMLIGGTFTTVGTNTANRIVGLKMDNTLTRGRPIIITGFCNNPRGANTGLPGSELSTTSGSDTHLGGFEYMQFMATEDIDFSITPYSVVTSVNSSTAQEATPGYLTNGWATGGARTYKFNLTSGTVRKGKCFYVGGPEKRINGSYAGVKSTDISETAPVSTNRANWIRTKVYVTEAGDGGIGNANRGVLSILSPSGLVAGFAIFKGTSVSASSVPIDAVFMNNTGSLSDAKIYDAINVKGLRIPNNDLYRSENYNLQPFMGQGTNDISTVLPPSPEDGSFCQLGGVYDLYSDTWTTPRSAHYKTIAQNAPLSEIEGGSTATSAYVGRSIIITGFCSNPKGSNTGFPGTSLSTASGSDTHLGGFDYMQFMAMEDIDFSVTPYSVITNVNSGAAQDATPGYLTNGWATGGTRTYKFNLTSGTVQKGKYFYVGGPEKRINGHFAGVKSTDISETAPVPTNRANWIRTKVYVTAAGDDGVGDANRGAISILSPSGLVSGFAIFAGTNVSASSVPVDAVFMNNTASISGAKIYDTANATGLRIPDNDLYNSESSINHDSQPFMGQGTNDITTVLPPSPEDGSFCQLGGQYYQGTDTWVVPRSAHYKTVAQNAPLSEIEGGSAATLVSTGRPVIITGFCSNPKGANTGLPGTNLSTVSGSDTHLGGFEYMQFKANEDIDFSVTPYSVITNVNSGAAQDATPGYLTNGWATGGSRTYKFNLTSGTVQKGKYFYVGGPEKRINGYYEGVKSTDISETAPVLTNRANWIRTKVYTTAVGDDSIGDANRGALPILSPSGLVAGFAIFSGTNISASSVPVDAVFMNNTASISGAKIYDTVNVTGLRVPDNDLYDTVNPINHSSQPFMGQGTNDITTVLPPSPEDGSFCQLDGLYDPYSNKWVVPRSAYYKTLAQNAPLSEIEGGNNVTMMPVFLTLFTGLKRGNMVELNWETVAEQNNNRFEILRSGEKRGFTKIKTITGQGASNSKNSYSMIDFYPLTGTNYYKLVQIDNNGASTEAKDIVALTFDEKLIGLKVYIVNNQQIEIVFNTQAKGKATFQITDILGRNLLLKDLSVEEGINQITIPVTLSDGAYVATLITEKGKNSVKFIK